MKGIAIALAIITILLAYAIIGLSRRVRALEVDKRVQEAVIKNHGARIDVIDASVHELSEWSKQFERPHRPLVPPPPPPIGGLRG